MIAGSKLLRTTLWALCFQCVFLSLAHAHHETSAAESQAAGITVSGITVIETTPLNERSHDFLLDSEFLVKPMPVRVTLPANYHESPSTAYPVIYFLHGGAADHTQWTDLGIEAISEGMDVILVQPFGGQGSWYRDARYASVGSKIQWESYFIQDVIPWVDQHFRTHASAQQRAIVGLSMGGYGATVIAARFPEYFSSVSSFSGAVDISGWLVACWVGVSPFIDVRLPFTIFGLWPFDEQVRLQNNPLSLAENLKGKHLAFYFGNGNKGELDDYNPLNLPYRFMGWLQEKQVHNMNVAMHQKLLALGVEHDYKPYGDGMHAHAWWERSLKEELPIIMTVFEKNRTATEF